MTDFSSVSPVSSGISSAVDSPNPKAATELKRSYNLAFALFSVGLLLGIGRPWEGMLLMVHGVFLFIETTIVRIVFTPTSCYVYRRGKLVRTHPYGEWQYAEFFWLPVPTVFRFRDFKGPHFWPIIFDPIAFKACLDKYNLLKE
ncbi:MAG: DUF3119 family protein [Cyanobacteria bacterium P01_F01_bin.150]